MVDIKASSDLDESIDNPFAPALHAFSLFHSHQPVVGRAAAAALGQTNARCELRDVAELDAPGSADLFTALRCRSPRFDVPRGGLSEPTRGL